MPDIAICNAKPKPSKSHSWLCEWLFLGWTKSLCLKNRLCYTRGGRETRNPYSSASSLPVFSRAAHVTDALLYYSRDEAQTSAFFFSKQENYLYHICMIELPCMMMLPVTAIHKAKPQPHWSYSRWCKWAKKRLFLENKKSVLEKQTLLHMDRKREAIWASPQKSWVFPCGHCRIVMTLNNMSDFMQQYIHCKELLILVDTLCVYSDLQWTIEHHVLTFFSLTFLQL